MTTAVTEPVTDLDVAVGPLEEADVPAADQVFRLAFGTMLGLPEPLRFGEGAEMVRSRWHADPSAAFAARVGGELVGCAFVARWGSFAIFGPLAVRPDVWDRGVGKRLWEARLPLLDRWGTTHAGLFTRPDSTKHVHLYQKFGFWPRFLTALTAKPIEAPPVAPPAWHTFSELSEGERQACLADCRALTGTLYPGLDLEREIRVLQDQGIGDTVLIDRGGRLEGFAVCHAGTGSEAGPDVCSVKFAAAASGDGAGGRLERLLDACEAFAKSRGLPRLVAGVNMGREEAYRILLARGHRAVAQGVAMHRPNAPGYDRPGVYALDGWR
jgi:GNAT superfamily N-acetyltransferase